MPAALYQPGIMPPDSRPGVSNDNPHAESLFKSLKYRLDHQPKGLSSLEETREWVSGFVRRYNYEHHHSGLNFLTPQQRRSGGSDKILAGHHAVHEAARAAHPEHWKGRASRGWSLGNRVYLNPEKIQEGDVEVMEAKAS